jgi:predicted DNA binding protein
MIEAVVRLSLPCTWVTELTELDAIVNIVEQKPVAKALLRTLVEIDPGPCNPTEIETTLRRNPYVADLEAIVPPKGKILATLQVRECHACSILARSECFLTEATATERRGVEWRILAPARGAVGDLVRTLREQGLDVEVLGIRAARGSGALTERQDQVLSLAHKLGYFEFPKKINLSDLAKKLGVAKSTLSEILRTGEEKILHEYFQRVLKRRR